MIRINDKWKICYPLWNYKRRIRLTFLKKKCMKVQEHVRFNSIETTGKNTKRPFSGWQKSICVAAKYLSREAIFFKARLAWRDIISYIFRASFTQYFKDVLLLIICSSWVTRLRYLKSYFVSKVNFYFKSRNIQTWKIRKKSGKIRKPDEVPEK